MSLLAAAASCCLFTVSAREPVQRPPVKPPTDLLVPFDMLVDRFTLDWATNSATAVIRMRGTLPAKYDVQGYKMQILFEFRGPVERIRPGGPSPGTGMIVDADGRTRHYEKHEVWVPYGKSQREYVVRSGFDAKLNHVEALVMIPWFTEDANHGNDTRKVTASRPPRPAERPKYITAFTAKPLGDTGNRLRVQIKVTNPSGNTRRDMRVVLVKGHSAVKEWKPVGLGGHASAQMSWDDSLPAAGVTNRYRAILTTDLTSPLPPTATVLDSAETSYRRGTTVRGGP